MVILRMVAAGLVVFGTACVLVWIEERHSRQAAKMVAAFILGAGLAAGVLLW